MIVVDTNVLAYLYLPNQYTPATEALLEAHPVWVAPVLWRSEFRNVLALYLRKKIITYEQALQIQREAESLMAGNEFEMESAHVLSLVNASDGSAYDCEFVSLAMSLNAALYTMDKKVLKAFPEQACPLKYRGN